VTAPSSGAGRTVELLDAKTCLVGGYASTVSDEFFVARYPSPLLSLGFVEMIFHRIMKNGTILGKYAFSQFKQTSYFTLGLFGLCL
jgi:hypothetical protein